MEILNFLCYASAILFFGVAFIICVAFFVTSIYACFTKKIKGDLFSKIFLAIFLGCLSPWILKLVFMFFGKLGV